MGRIRTVATATMIAVGIALGSVTAAEAAPAPKCLTMYGEQVPPNIAKLICKDPNQARPIGPHDKPPTRKQLLQCAAGVLKRSPDVAVDALWCLFDLVGPDF